MALAISTVLNLPFDEAVARTRAALADQGFGILTEINVKDTLKTKIDADMENYLILGACNPPLAHRALEINRQIGLLLPCNVVVRSTGERRTVVEAVDPDMMVGVTDNEQLQDVAADARTRLDTALASLPSRVS